MEDSLLKELPKPWQKFFLKFKEIDLLEKKDWSDTHILAYIARRYENMYGRSLAIAIKGAPSKSSELFFVKKMKVLLNTTNPIVIAEYIDWCFDTKIAPKRYQIKSLGFFIVSSFVPEFYQSKDKTIRPTSVSRTTDIPPAYIDMAKELDISISSYADLAFIQMKIERSKDESSKYFQLMENLKLIGLDVEKIKGMK
jgi:hypothetical protein